MNNVREDDRGSGPAADADDENLPGDERPDHADSEVPDLKATVTLSGEALAALLEEVKNAKAATESETPADEHTSSEALAAASDADGSQK
jgi:hypothetical protein